MIYLWNTILSSNFKNPFAYLWLLIKEKILMANWKGGIYFTYYGLLYLIYLGNVALKPYLIWAGNWQKIAKS